MKKKLKIEHERLRVLRGQIKETGSLLDVLDYVSNRIMDGLCRKTKQDSITNVGLSLLDVTDY
ncbi:hypothetical protein DGG96_03635 [Legionella qingyii]|uniref:Uncharacterized protein n=1 Tax=Legionella qingyii TaxID=2184757 RepID=A0A317U9L6_9GAMM|nr:hypothetical protein DGG96_03635 [Legionella qingyii]